jgi:fructokinase
MSLFTPTQPLESSRHFGGVDAGGTKFLCAIGTAQGKIERVVSIRTETPDMTLGKVAAFFNGWLAEGKALAGVGICAFGPLCRDPRESDYGKLRNSPKPGWGAVDILGSIRERLQAPLALDTDVNGAALAEGRWGAAAAKDIRHYAYVTVGTGVGVGVVADGRLINGVAHPELGHYRPPRQEGDLFEAICPFHGDCLEGLVSGPAIERRAGKSGNELADNDPVWRIVANYLAHLCSILILGFSPQRIIIGGGVMDRTVLFPMIREETRRLLGGYLSHPLHCGDLAEIIVPSGLAVRHANGLVVNAGVLGGLILAQQAIDRRL